MIFTVWWRLMFHRATYFVKNNLQPIGFNEITNPVFCTKKWVFCACSCTISEIISLSIERWFSKPCYKIHHTCSTFISLHFCATSSGLLLATMHPFQANALLVNSSNGSCSLKDTPWLQRLLHKVTLDYPPVLTKGHFSMKTIHYWTDWQCTQSAVTGSLEDVCSRISKNKNLHLPLALNDFTETLLCDSFVC